MNMNYNIVYYCIELDFNINQLFADVYRMLRWRNIPFVYVVAAAETSIS